MSRHILQDMRESEPNNELLQSAVLHVAAAQGDDLVRAVRIGISKSDYLTPTDIIAMIGSVHEGAEERYNERVAAIQRQAKIRRVGQLISRGLLYGAQCMNPAFVWSLSRPSK